jgi:hypothetical protein
MRVTDTALNDEQWEVRETYAAFGRAFYTSCLLEVGLAHVLMFGEFMLQERGKLVAGGEGFDQIRYTRDFDTYMDNQFKQTMGNTIKRAQALPYFDDALKARIKAAKERRDFLTHHYWRENSIRMTTPAGRSAMWDELHADAAMFAALDKDVEAALKPVFKQLGVNEEIFEVQSCALLEKLRAEVI